MPGVSRAFIDKKGNCIFMDKIKAYIESIVYYNPDNHYAVLSVSCQDVEFTAVGYFPFISAGETIDAEGEFTEHPLYGEQFQVKEYHVVEPEGADAIERYLASGSIKGIGPALAKKIVKKFKNDTFRIMEEEPERLQEIKGISERMARDIAEQMELKRGMRDAVIFMQDYGISSNLANKIYDKYGPGLYSVIEGNPYKLAEDIDGVGFKLADSIARKAGLAEDSEFRIKCGIEYSLYTAQTNGHTWLPKDELGRYACELLELKDIKLDEYLADMQIEGKIICTGDEQAEIYLSSLYYMEKNTAIMLNALNIRGESDDAFVQRRIMRIQSEEDIVLDDKQADAVKASVNNGVLIITGGPGTGKTTTINTIIKYYEEDNQEIALAAPTGRAAKRMSEATGYEAKTIHRLLEYTGKPEEDDRERNRQSSRFLRDQKNPLEADVVIVDEMSMVDIYLMEALLKAVVPGTRLILVGDANQLPSVGAGNVLKDMIDSGEYKTVCLTHIFRQAAVSDIVVNAHKINNGENVELGKPSRDFLFIKGLNPKSITEAIKTLVMDKLPKYVKSGVSEIQVLTPTRKGALGVENLNVELQKFLNPPSKNKAEKTSGLTVFRQFDKVMQIKNNYDIEWEKRTKNGIAYEKGTGVFNGDIGVIKNIDKAADQITVLFDDEKYVVYNTKTLEELELAYAVTVHKSQGSEYPAVVMPMYYGPHMLMNRNLLYTAVTRAKKCVCIVGLPQVFNEMEQNENENKRYSGLKSRILDIRENGVMPDNFIESEDFSFDEEFSDT